MDKWPSGTGSSTANNGTKISKENLYKLVPSHENCVLCSAVTVGVTAKHIRPSLDPEWIAINDDEWALRLITCN